MARTALAVLVRRSRHAAWMTQEELAAKSGLSPRTIQAIERGDVSRPHRESVRLLADALGLGGEARVEFERVARHGSQPPADGQCGCGRRECPSAPELARCLTQQLSTCETQPVDLTGLGPAASPAVVLARLLQALGVEQDGDYGFTSSEVPNHTLPVQVLPGA